MAQTSGRAAFTEALRDFGLAVRGEFGDEGPGLRSSLDAMRRALTVWDEEIRRQESAVAAQLPAATPDRAAILHAALGAVQIDRGRVADARREFVAAAALDPTRSDFRRFQALAQELLGEPAIDAFRAAADLDPAAPARGYQLARALLDAGQTAEATKELERFLAHPSFTATVTPPGNGAPPFLQTGLVPEIADIEPFFAPVRYAAGFGHLRGGDYSTAIEQFTLALRDDPLLAERGEETRILGRAGAALRSGLVTDAIRLLQSAIEDAPSASEPHRMLGHAYLLDQQHDNAVAALRNAVRLDPADERTRLSLARTLIAAERMAEAAQALTEALQAVPQSGQMRYELGLVHRHEGRYDEAIAAFVASLAFNPLLGANSIHRTIGALERSRQAFDAAAAAFSSRIRLVPNDAAAHHELGEIYMRLGRDTEALAEFTVAVMLDPRAARSLAAAAQIHLRQARYPEAIVAATRALDVDARHREARYARATALMRLGRTVEGGRELDVVRQQQAEDAAARNRAFELGALRREAALSAASGDRNRAIELLQKVVDADPLVPASLVELALVLIDAGRHAEAVLRLEKAIEFGGSHEIHRHLAETYRVLGQVEKSRQARARYEELKREALRQANPAP
jgi:tetratricopeptide (TPR) repeat protein